MNDLIRDIDNPADCYSWFRKHFPDWTPDKIDDIRYRVNFRWPFPLDHQDVTDKGEILGSIWEWQKMVWKKYTLSEDLDYAAAFFHTWGLSTSNGGWLSLTLQSDMNEAISEVMGQATMHLLTVKGFTIRFDTLY